MASYVSVFFVAAFLGMGLTRGSALNWKLTAIWLSLNVWGSVTLGLVCYVVDDIKDGLALAAGVAIVFLIGGFGIAPSAAPAGLVGEFFAILVGKTVGGWLVIITLASLTGGAVLKSRKADKPTDPTDEASKRVQVSSLIAIIGCVVFIFQHSNTFDIVEITSSVVPAVLIGTHILLFPLYSLFGAVIAVAMRIKPDRADSFWVVHPIHWDETIFLPLPGLSFALGQLSQANPALGQKAIADIAAHRFMRQTVRKALVAIAKNQALLVDTLSALAAFERGLGWVNERAELSESTRALLAGMRDISREAAGAVESQSATNRIHRLSEAARLLDILRHTPGPFALALSRWGEILGPAVERAKFDQQLSEPVHQVYLADGTPISLTDRSLLFKGRAALFRQLENALGPDVDRRSSLLLYGQRRAGKTSALLQLPVRLGSLVVPVFADLQSEKIGSAASAGGLLRGLCSVITDEALRRRGLVLPTIKAESFAVDPFPAFGQWLDSVESHLGDRSLLLCLDEFETLEEGIADGRFDTRVLSMIRNIVQHRKQISVLLSGSHEISELPSRWASALVNTRMLHISFLEEQDARELIERPVPDFSAIYAPEAVDFIVKETHCHPYLVQLTCSLLVERINAVRRRSPNSVVSEDDVRSVIPSVLKSGSAFFSDLWSNQTGDETAKRVLLTIACSSSVEGLPFEKLRTIERNESKLTKALETLMRREIVARDESRVYCRVVVPLVSEYVRQRSQL